MRVVAGVSEVGGVGVRCRGGVSEVVCDSNREERAGVGVWCGAGLGQAARAGVEVSWC